jgi:carboxymethylenebutenolidase
LELVFIPHSGDRSAAPGWHEFNAQHAFLRDEGPRYDPALASHCYGLVMELFHRKLGQGDLAG